MLFAPRCATARTVPAVFCIALWSALGSEALAIDLPKAGMNLAGYSYWGTGLPFYDVAHMGDRWLSMALDGLTPNTDRTIAVDSLGYPTALASDEIAVTLVFTHNGRHYPTGQYELAWSGNGNVRLQPSPEIIEVSRAPGRVVYNVTATDDKGLYLEISETDPANPVRNIGLHAPLPNGNGAFNPKYKSDLAKYGVIRYMDWNMTNNQSISKWDDRTTLYDFHWGGAGGVPYESQIQLSNELKQDVWLTVPHLADDDYVRKLAILVSQRLSPDLRVWVEYSNEVWNGGFQQHRYAADVLRPRYGVANPAQAYGRRSAEIFDIFSSEFTDQQRIVRVIAGQTVNPWVLEQSLIGATAGGTLKADVAAVAPYFSVDSDQLYQQYLTGTVNSDDVFGQLRSSIDTATSGVVGNRQAATAHGLPLVSYEGGQHLVARPGDQHNNAGFVSLLHAINRDPRMGDLYTYYLDKWYGAGGETMVFFNDVGPWSKWGSWGLKEDYLDDDSVKFRAVQDYLKRFETQPPDPGQNGYNIWRAAYGSDQYLWADLNDDGIVNGADYILLRKFGIAAFTGPANSMFMAGHTALPSIPEPSTVSLSIAAAVVLFGMCVLP
jgi:hypothetical protein